MDISNVLLNPEKVEGGMWVDAEDLEGVRFHVRGSFSSEYARTLGALQRAATDDDREADGSLKPEVSRRIMGEALATGLLIGWDGLEANGEPLEYTPELATRILSAPEGRRLAAAVLAAAAKVDREKSEAYEAILGN